jgi:hypothetical protein
MMTDHLASGGVEVPGPTELRRELQELVAGNADDTPVVDGVDLRR